MKHEPRKAVEIFTAPIVKKIIEANENRGMVKEPPEPKEYKKGYKK